MKREELRRLLAANGVRDDAYELSGGDVDEAYVLGKERGRWVVFYSERGLRSGVQRFQSEDEACRYLYEELLGDSAARR